MVRPSCNINSAESSSSIQSQPEQQQYHLQTKISLKQNSASHVHLLLSTTPGLKLVIDNMVRSRHQRVDTQTKSLHYVRVHALKDRINYSNLSHSPPSAGKTSFLSDTFDVSLSGSKGKLPHYCGSQTGQIYSILLRRLQRPHWSTHTIQIQLREGREVRCS